MPCPATAGFITASRISNSAVQGTHPIRYTIDHSMHPLSVIITLHLLWILYNPPSPV